MTIRSRCSVTDSAKKTSTDTSTVVKSLNVAPGQPPQAMLELVSPQRSGPYPLGTTFKISGALSMGGDAADPLDPQWKLDTSGASSSVASLQPCADDPTSELVRCFTADVEGTYAVQLQVASDGTPSQVATLTPSLQVLGDQPPCIGMSTPSVTTPTISAPAEDGLEFTIGTVCDDLDPFSAVAPPMTSATPLSPNGKSHFQWFIDRGDGNGLNPTWEDLSWFQIDPKEFQTGDQVRVRLQITDADTDRSAKEFQACTDDTCSSGVENDSCAAPEDHVICYQRMTWTVNFNL